MTVTKAIIEVEAKAVDESRGLPKRFEVQFNPTEVSLSKKVAYWRTAVQGLQEPVLTFIRGRDETLTLDLFFDATAKGMGAGAPGVLEQIESFRQLVEVQPKTHAPPRVTVTWGKTLSFHAVVEGLTQKFTLFSPDGVPLRATLSVTFKQFTPTEEQLKELNLQSSDHFKTRVVRQGDSLTSIAAEEYDTPRAWKYIADHNSGAIADPRRLVPGTVLTLPPLEDWQSPS